ncbi:hypothetical protein ACFYU8_18490 [Brevibacillus sp. NPDC003359]|uniref:hypothetical protein n=1 Tax=unclassified Brevibacillus TaxID=2684853 RepID=UPI0036BB83D3
MEKTMNSNDSYENESELAKEIRRSINRLGKRFLPFYWRWCVVAILIGSIYTFFENIKEPVTINNKKLFSIQQPDRESLASGENKWLEGDM